MGKERVFNLTDDDKYHQFSVSLTASFRLSSLSLQKEQR